MLQHRPFLVRCLLACLMALLGLLAVGSLSLGTVTPRARAVTGNRSLLVTSTAAISTDLSPENGIFYDVGASLPGVRYGSASWGDCNNDRKADVLLTGEVSTTARIAQVYQQDNEGGFTLAAVLTGVINGAAAWGDYDNDGWLDIVVTGDSANGPISQLWHNERNGTTCTFSLAATNLIGVRDSTVAWGDYNNDGQLDLLLAGNDGLRPVTKLYRNDHGSFVDSGLNLPGIQNGAAAWGDYDNDGLPDLLLTGLTISGTSLTRIYHNDGKGGLIDIQAGLQPLHDSAAAWGDYDNNGQLDLLLEGTTDGGDTNAEIYRNNHGVFTINSRAILTGGLTWKGVAWGDYDNDGYLDALVNSEGTAAAYRNDTAGSFGPEIDIGPSALFGGSAAWGHYDIDRSLEVLVTGQSLSGLITRIYKYPISTGNMQPSAPAYLTTTIVESNVVLSWSPAISDDHTPLAGLSYNLQVGTQPGGIDIVAPMAMTDTGYRSIPGLGNTDSSLSFTLRGLSVGRRYYWSVQAIDTSFVGSNFANEANEKSFLIPYRVFLPVIQKNFFAYYTNDWETEPNDTYLQANGPLISGRMYYGYHDDEKDYYSVYLQNGGSLNVDMTSPNGGTQIQLFYQVADVAHRVGFDPTPPYHIGLTSAQAGWYYIYVYTNPAYLAPTQVYTLTATYP